MRAVTCRAICFGALFLTIASSTSKQSDHNLPLQPSKRLTLPIRFENQSKLDVTITTQLSVDRMWLLRGLSARWDGYVVAAVFIPLGSYEVFRKQRSQLTHAFPRLLRILHHKADLVETVAAYPVNRMRNIAFSGVETSHSLMVDVDMWPSFQLRHYLVTALNNNKSTPELARGNRSLIVVPPFAYWARHSVEAGSRVIVESIVDGHTYDNQIPGHFPTLANCFTPLHNSIDPRLCTLFEGIPDPRNERVCCASTCRTCGRCEKGRSECCRKHISKSGKICSTNSSSPCMRAIVKRRQDRKCSVFDHGNVGAHSSMGLNEWWGQAPGRLRRISCIDSERFEPYVMMRTSVARERKYNEELTGYGKNKIEFIQRLWLEGFAFFVIGQGFIFHHPHPESPSAKIWRNQGDFQNSTMKIKNDALFANEMAAFTADINMSAPLATPCCKTMLLSHITVEKPPAWCS